MTVKRFTLDELPDIVDISAKMVPHVQTFESADRLTRKVYDWGATRLEVTLKVHVDTEAGQRFITWLMARGRIERFSLPLGRIPGFFGCEPDLVYNNQNILTLEGRTSNFSAGDRTLANVFGAGSGPDSQEEVDSRIGCLLQVSYDPYATGINTVIQNPDTHDYKPEGKVYLITGGSGPNRTVDIDPPLYEVPFSESRNSIFVIGILVEPVFRCEGDIDLRTDPESPGDSLATIKLVEDVEIDRPVVVTLSTTTPRVGSSISVDVYDPDGPITGITYQWQRQVNAAGDWVNVSGETGAQFDLDLDAYAADLVRVVIDYTDSDGDAQEVTSAASGAVEARPAGPETMPPAVPTGLVFTGADFWGVNYLVAADWDDVDHATAYQAEFESQTYDVSVFSTSTSSNGIAFLNISSFEATGQQFRVRVRAINTHGNSDWSSWVSFTGTSLDYSGIGYNPGL